MTEDLEQEERQKLKAEAAEEISGIWNDVLVTVNKLLKADKVFGFENIESRVDPSIPEILHSLSVLDLILDQLSESEHLGPDEIRQALNSKQCILIIRMLASAIATSDEQEYRRA